MTDLVRDYLERGLSRRAFIRRTTAAGFSLAAAESAMNALEPLISAADHDAPATDLTRPGIRAIRWRRRGREKFRGRKKEERHDESSAGQIGKRRDHAPRIR